jgi:hypothetical protein
MYIALLMLLLAVGGALVFNGVQRHRPKTLSAGSFVLLLTGLFFGLLSFWGEMLWFEELGQSERFWTVVFAQGSFAAVGALAGALGVLILTLPIPVQTPLARSRMPKSPSDLELEISSCVIPRPLSRIWRIRLPACARKLIQTSVASACRATLVRAS